LKVSLKRWRLGLRIAALSGLCGGVVCFVTDMNWKQTIAVVACAVAREVQQYIKDNPLSEIEETQTIAKQ
jgi:hypothetical protein